jgi:putative ABC transport system permease protein
VINEGSVRVLGELWRRLVVLVRWSAVARDLDDELRQHVDRRASRLIERGVAAADAGAMARRRFGNMTAIREEAMSVWSWRWLGQLTQDLRFGARMLRRDPTFAVSAVLTLGLATGATTAVFSIVSGLLLRPLPFPDPDRLIAVYGRNWSEDRGTTPDPVTGPVASLELEAMSASQSFAAVAGYAATTRHLEHADGVERIRVVMADRTLFDVMRVNPIVGRTFAADDPQGVAVLSERTWRTRFNADRTITAQTITIEGRVHAVIGVMPDSFEFPYYQTQSSVASMPSGGRTEAWVPLDPVRSSTDAQLRRGRVSVVARMAPGTRVEQAAAELTVIAGRVEAEYYRGTRTRATLRAVPLADDIVRPVRSSLWLLFAAVALVLAAACANVANLLLVRMLVRTREVVTRAALGAGRLRLVRQFLAESLLLAGLGGVVGMAIASGGTRALIAFYQGRLPRLHEVALDWRPFAFLLIACAIAAAVVGLAPAVAAARIDPFEVTRTGGGQATTGRQTRRVRDGLVILEVMVAFVLAVGAALIVREIGRLQAIPSGMAIDNAVVLHLTPRTTPADYHAIEERAAAVPGVQAAGFIQYVPLQNAGWMAGFEVRGRPPVAGERLVADLRYVTQGYFRAAGIPLVSGRGFASGDTAEAPRVVLVNQAFARRYFPGADPIGRELDRGTIIGIVGDVRSAELGRPAEPELYYTIDQNIATTDVGMSLVVRSAVPVESSLGRIRAAVTAVNPKLAIFNVKTLQQIVAESLWQLRLYRWLIGLFAIVAIALATIGLYAMIAYTAGSRTREFAIRRALGSASSNIVRLIVTRGLSLGALGVGGGVAAVLFLTWWLGDRTGGIRPDVVTCAMVAAFFIAVSGIAGIGPSMRAATVDPTTALRDG